MGRLDGMVGNPSRRRNDILIVKTGFHTKYVLYIDEIRPLDRVK